MVLASEDAVKRQNLKPLARLVGYSVVGVEPSIMGIGPSPAIQKLLAKTGKTLNDIELVEVCRYLMIDTVVGISTLFSNFITYLRANEFLTNGALFPSYSNLL